MVPVPRRRSGFVEVLEKSSVTRDTLGKYLGIVLAEPGFASVRLEDGAGERVMLGR
jgi:hypothetical protein